MTLWVYSGRPSESAFLLSQQPGFKRMKGGKLVKNDDVIVNWGSGAGLPVVTPVILNQPKAILNAVNKLRTFHILAGKNVQTVPWTANQAVAKEWLAEGSTVIARKTLTGHEGDGIIIIEKVKELVEAPLYSKYIFKVREYRVHATCEEAFATHKKVRDPTREPTNWKVRSWKNGFIFQRNNVQPNAKRDALAVQAIAALGLDFGAVDIIEDKNGKFYVLEVNTAPGIEGTSVPTYGAALTKLANTRLGELAGGAPAPAVVGHPGAAAAVVGPQDVAKGPEDDGTIAIKTAIRTIVSALGKFKDGETADQYVQRLFAA